MKAKNTMAEKRNIWRKWRKKENDNEESNMKES